jgi:signal peptidase I
MELFADLRLKSILTLIGLLLVGRAFLAVRRAIGSRRAGTVCEFVDAALVALVLVFLIVRPFLFQAYFIPSESMHPTLQRSDRILVNKLIARIRAPERGELIVFRPPEERVQVVKDYVKRVVALPGETIEVVPDRLLVDGRVAMNLARQSTFAAAASPDDRPGRAFVYGQGSVYVNEGTAVIHTEVDRRVVVTTYQDESQIREEEDHVFLNGEPVLSIVFGPLTVTRDLGRWGGDRELEGRIYWAQGGPRLILIRGTAVSQEPGHVLIDGRSLIEPYIAEEPSYRLAPFEVPPGHLFVLGDNRNRSSDSHEWGPLPIDRVVGRAEFIFWPLPRIRRITHPD